MNEERNGKIHLRAGSLRSGAWTDIFTLTVNIYDDKHRLSGHKHIKTYSNFMLYFKSFRQVLHIMLKCHVYRDTDLSMLE